MGADVTDLTSLYQAMLTSPAITAATQQRILRYARTAKNTGLLVRLANLPNLDPDVDDVLGLITIAAVRAAWLTRPGRRAANITAALQTETRSAVCVAVAAVAGLPGDVYDRLADLGDGKVAKALLANRAVPASVKLRASRTFTDLPFTYSRTMSTMLATAVQQEPGIETVFAMHGCDRWLIEHGAGSVALTDEALERIVTIVAAAALPDGVRNDVTLPWWTPLRSLAGNPRLTPDQATRLLSAATVNGSIVHPYRNDPMSDAALAEKLTAAAKRTGFYQPGTTDGASTTADLDGLVKVACRNRDLRLGLQILAHPLLTAGIARTLRLSLFSHGVSDEVLHRHTASPEIQAALLADDFDLRDDDLNRTADPSQVLLAYLQHVPNARIRKVPGEQARTSKYLTEVHLRALPVAALTDLGYAGLRERLAIYLGEQLVGDHEWETFEAMAQDPSAIVGDCLDTAHLMLEQASL
jgi:hypothetical protein